MSIPKEIISGVIVIALLTLYTHAITLSHSQPINKESCSAETYYLGEYIITIHKLNLSDNKKKIALKLIENINSKRSSYVILSMLDNKIKVNLILLSNLTNNEAIEINNTAIKLASILNASLNIIDLRHLYIKPIQDDTYYINITYKIMNSIRNETSDILGLSISINKEKGIVLVTTSIINNNNINISDIISIIEDAYVTTTGDCGRPLLIIAASEPTVQKRTDTLSEDIVSLEPVETLPSPTPPAPQEIGPPLILPVALALAAGLLLALFRIV